MFLLFFLSFSLSHTYIHIHLHIYPCLICLCLPVKAPRCQPLPAELAGVECVELGVWKPRIDPKSMGFNMVTSSAIKDCSYRKIDNHCYINLDGYNGDLVFWAIGQVPCCIIDHYSSRGIGNAPCGQMSLCQSHVRKSRLNHLDGNP